MKRVAKLFGVLCVLAVAACTQGTAPKPAPVLSFADKAAIQLDVAQLEIRPEYVSPGRSPNIEHIMPLSPEAGVVRWAQDRLKPMGRTGYARVVIQDAKVVEVPLPVEDGFKGMFKKQQSERYDGSLDVAVQILDERHFPIADVVARATRSRSVPEGISLNERDQVLFEITESLVRDVDSQIDGLIRSYLSRWVMN